MGSPMDVATINETINFIDERKPRENMRAGWLECRATSATTLDDDDCARLLKLPASSPADAQQSAPLSLAPGHMPLRAILFFDQTSWAPDNLPERDDRMTMGASIEGRMPFLDHGFVDTQRVRGFTTKRILCVAMRHLLPAHTLHKLMSGFRVPQSPSSALRCATICSRT